MSGITGKYECGNCSHVLSPSEALCEDWRVKSKSLVCPKCRYYLEVPHNPRYKWAVIATIFAAILGVALSIINGFAGRPLLGCFVFIALPAWLYAKHDLFKAVKTNALGKSTI